MHQFEIKNILDKKLKKDYQVLVPYALIDERIDVEVLDIKKNYKMKGFRHGQVPVEIIKQKYEASIMADEAQKIINEVSQKIIKDNDLKLAIAPKVKIEIFEPKKDFSYNVSMELFPTVPEIDLTKLKLTKKEVEVSKKDIDEAIARISSNYKEWEKQENSYKAKKGDAVNIDYAGKIDDVAFEGGSAESYQLELGSKSFIDDFEDQLIGKKAGDEVKVKVKFPKEYHNDNYAGKKAVFDVKINSVLKSKEFELSDEFVKDKFGVENLAKFEEEVKKQVTNGYEASSKNLFKRELFEILNKKFDFELPEGLVEEQFKRVWEETEAELKQNPDKFKNEKEEKKAKSEKRTLAEKMVRSGIILSEISKDNKVTISNEELIEEINKKASQFPGQEQLIAQYYQKNPEAVQEIRGFLLEEKVVELIMKNSNLEIKNISFKDLEKELSKA